MKAKKVLMLCYHYPPHGTSGTARSQAFSTNLRTHGWEPVVLTRPAGRASQASAREPVPDGVHVERSPEWNLGGVVRLLQGGANRFYRLLGMELRTNYFRDLLCVPDEQIAWLSTIRGARLALECNVVYASCSPFSSALSAARIKRLTGRPLVLDFRDVWAINAYVDRTPVRAWYEGLMERSVLKAADMLVTNTEGAGRLYQQHYPQYAHKVRVVPNGYDRLNPAVPDITPARCFEILHAGTFYGHRTPDLLLEALAEIGNPQIRFVQVGAPFPVPDRLRARVHVEFTGVLPRQEALRRLRTASLLYLKQRHDDRGQAYVAVAAKTYEYLATGLPILVDCPPGDNRDMVERYCCHAYIPRDQTVGGLKEAVLRAFDERRDRWPETPASFIRDFDRVALTGRLAGILDQVSTTHARRRRRGR